MRTEMRTLKVSIDQATMTIQLSREIFTDEAVLRYQGKKAVELFPSGSIAGIPIGDTLDDFPSYILDFIPGVLINNDDDMEVN